MRTSNNSLKKLLLISGIVVGLKMLFSVASIDQLKWFISAIVYLVEFLTGITFEWISGKGFVSNANTIIEKSCSGGNFFIICLALILFHQWNLTKLSVSLIGLIKYTLLSYLITIICNTMRIASALKLLGFEWATNYIPKENLHLLLGSVLYVLTLLFIHYLFTNNNEKLQNS